MRIAIIVDCYYPHSTASAKLVRDLGVEMRKQGHDVIVVTPSCLIAEDFELSNESGLLVARVKTGKLKGVSKVSRAIREARLSATMWRKGKKFFRDHPCDLIIFYSPSIFFGPLVRKLKSLWGCPAYLILRDIFPQWAVDAGVLKKGLIYRFFRMKELEQYAAADIIGVQSPANLRYFSNSLPNKRYDLEVLHNWTALEEPDFVPSNYRERLGLQDKVVFFYGGNIGVAQDMDNIIRLACGLSREPRIQFLLVGNGSEVERLKAMIAAKALTNIRILPAVGQEEYLAMLSEFDVGLVSLDRRLQTQNFPGKILGYMYFSMPMLCSLNPGNDLKEMVEGSEAGLCCLNGDDETLRANALRLANKAELRQKLGRNARQLLERDFSVSVVARRILSHFKEAPGLRYADAEKPLAPATATLRFGPTDF
jgi:glycosyltransferase involved in cell wall biosynthesis